MKILKIMFSPALHFYFLDMCYDSFLWITKTHVTHELIERKPLLAIDIPVSPRKIRGDFIAFSRFESVENIGLIRKNTKRKR